MKLMNRTFAVLAGVLTLFVSSCDRGKEYPSSYGKGNTIVKVLNAERVLAFDAVSNPQTGLLIDVRREAPDEKNLNTPVVVKLDFDMAFIDEYNEKNGTEYEPLPTEYYTTDIPAAPDGSYTISFAPGEFSKPIMFTLKDATLLDFTKQYAFAYTITSADNGAQVSVNNSGFIKVLVKNEWDGVYEVTGTMKDEAAALDGVFPMTYHLITAGANVVEGYEAVELKYWGIPILNAGTPSYYGNFSPVFEFDPATNEIVKVTNIFGQPDPATTRSAGLDPSGENYYDPATKTIKVKFFMYQPSSIPAAPHIRVYFDWTMKRMGDR
ncbi:MAG TPA: DUF1735 domain-containing protein [Flavihumibacter sp.]